MTVDKVSSSGIQFGNESALAAKVKAGQNVDFKGQNRSVALAQQAAPTSTPSLSPSTVSVSIAAKEMFSAVNSVSDDDEFDRDKVEQIRQEIASGRFPINEDRLARKFRELEQQLGNLGA